MIYLLPDQVLSLVGNHGAMADMGKDTEQKMHGMFMRFGNVTQSAAGGIRNKGLAEDRAAAEAAKGDKRLNG